MKTPISATSSAVGKSPTQTINEILQEIERAVWAGVFSPQPILRVDTHQEAGIPNLQVRFELSLREMVARHGQDMLQDMVSRVSSHFAVAIANRLENGGFDTLIDGAIAEAMRGEVRAQVKAEVAKRVDEFVDEMLT